MVTGTGRRWLPEGQDQRQISYQNDTKAPNPPWGLSLKTPDLWL